MANFFDKYDKSFAYQVFYPKNTNAWIWDIGWPNAEGKYPMVGAYFQFDGNNPTARLAATTGYYRALNSSVKAYQLFGGTDENRWVILSSELKNFEKYPTKSGYVAQDTMNELVANNLHILKNQLMCAKIINEIGASYPDVRIPEAYGQQMADLQRRLNARQSFVMENSGILKISTTSTDSLADKNSLYALQQIEKMFPAIGVVVSTTVVVVTSIIVTALAGTVIWALYSKYHTESKTDIKYSDKLVEDLKKYLPAEVYERLQKENAENAKKFNQLIDSASGRGILKTVSYVGAGLIGFLLINKYLLKNG